MAESEQEDLDVVDDFEHDSEIGFRSMDGDYRPAPDSHPASTLTPNVELAREAGLSVAGGVLVDSTLLSSHPDIYAVGDIAEAENPVTRPPGTGNHA